MSFPNIFAYKCRFCGETIDEVSSKYHNCIGTKKSIDFLDQQKIKDKEEKMVNLKEEAKAYESQRTFNIADLPEVSVMLNVEDRRATNEEGKEFSYKVIVVDKQEYRVPASVLKSLKAILEDNPNLKIFKVLKTGSGMGTEYTVVPLFE